MDATIRSTKPGQLRRAFSLMESLFASVLLAVSVTAIASALSASYAHRAASAERVDALAAAEQLLEQSISLPVKSDDGEVSILALSDYVDDLLLSGEVVPRTETIDSVLTSASTLTTTLTTTLNKTTTTVLTTGGELLSGAVNLTLDGGVVNGATGTDGSIDAAPTGSGSTIDAGSVTNGRVRRLIQVNADDGSVAASIARRSGGELVWVSVTVTGPTGNPVVVRRLVHNAEGRR